MLSRVVCIHVLTPTPHCDLRSLLSDWVRATGANPSLGSRVSEGPITSVAWVRCAVWSALAASLPRERGPAAENSFSHAFTLSLSRASP